MSNEKQQSESRVDLKQIVDEVFADAAVFRKGGVDVHILGTSEDPGIEELRRFDKKNSIDEFIMPPTFQTEKVNN